MRPRTTDHTDAGGVVRLSVVSAGVEVVGVMGIGRVLGRATTRIEE